MKLNSYIIQALLWVSFVCWIGAGQVLKAQVTLPYTEGFETAGPTTTFQTNTTAINGVPEWSFTQSIPEGRLRFQAGAGFYHTGSQAATLDMNPSTSGNGINYLIGTLDLAAYAGATDIEFSFWYMDHGEENNPNDRVWIRGNNTATWIEIYDLFAGSPTGGVYNFVSGLDIDSILTANGQVLSTTFQIRFGMEDNFPATSTTASDGFTFDDLTITGSLPIPDNAGITAITAPVSPINPGVASVDVDLFNFGTNTLDSVTIEWEVDGVAQTPFNWVGTLPTVTGTSVTLGTANFALGNRNIRAWTSMPNGLIDQDNANDTSETDILVCITLAGTYTIGGAAADYPTFADAVSALNSCGISGPTTFNINPGVYNENFKLSNINGLSATNTITFDGGSAATTFITDSMSNDTAIITLDGVDYITIKNVTIENKSETDAWCVQLTNQADYNTLDSIQFVLQPEVSSGDAVHVVFTDYLLSGATTTGAGTDNGNYNTVQNCTFIEGSQGIGMFGTSTSDYSVGNKILNCDFQGQQWDALYIYYQDSIEIIGNNVTANSASTSYDGMFLNNFSNFKVNRNNIVSPYRGVDLNNSNELAVPTQPSEFINNMIIGTNLYAIDFFDVRDVNMYHNNLSGAGTNAAAYFNDYPRMDIQNNIFFNSGVGLAVDFIDVVGSTSATGVTMDYNIYYTQGVELIEDGTTNYPDLASWQLGNASININSLQGDPFFVDPASDLHVFGLLAFGTGNPALGVLTDIDLDPRPLPPGLGVEIGADEYDLPQNDAGVEAITVPAGTIAPGMQALELGVRNYGVLNINSVNVDFTLNGTPGTQTAYATPIIPGTANSVPVGMVNIPAGTNTLRAWSSSPNGVIDEDFSNDTVEIVFCTGLSGVYTIGGAGADYADFASAVIDLEGCGVIGPTTFNINPGTYTESVYIENIPGVSAANTVTFNGGDSATTRITWVTPNDTPTVWLRGTDWVKFENLTIQNTGTTDAWAVQLSDTAENISFDKVHFLLLEQTNIFDAVGLNISNSIFSAASQGQNARNTTVSNSTFSGGYRGISAYGQSAAASFAYGLFVDNCVFQGQDDEGIYMFYYDTVEVRNSVFRASPSTTVWQGLDLSDIRNLKILANDIISPDQGIELDDINDTSTPTQNSEIVNNMIIAGPDDGMDLDDAENLVIYHNSIIGSPGLLINDYPDVDIRNNIFYSPSGLAVDFTDAVSSTTNAVLENNIYFTGGTDLADDGSSTYTSLLSWLTAVPTINDGSLEGDPGFVDPASDLHAFGLLPFGAGNPLVPVTVDIDGDPRPLPPQAGVEIGADEYDVKNLDAGITSLDAPVAPFVPGVNNFAFTIRNYGLNLIDSVDVFYSINGAAQPGLRYAIPISPASFAPNVAVSSATVPAGNSTIKAWTTSPNGMTDEDFSNDTLELRICTGLSGNYTIGGAGADYADFSAAVLDLNECGVIGPVNFTVNAGTYTETIELGIIPGASAATPITFEGVDQATTILTDSSVQVAIVVLNGADYVTFKNMTIENKSVNDSWCVQLTNQADYNSFDSVLFPLSNGTFDIAGILISDYLLSATSTTGAGPNANFTTIQNCTFTNGSNAICMFGESSSDDYTVGNRILNNTFSEQLTDAIYIWYQDSLEIMGNTMISTDGTYDGMDISNVRNIKINGNNITSGDRGIELDNVNDTGTQPLPGDYSEIINNMIISPNDDGMDFFDVEETNLYHNSVIGTPALLNNDFDRMEVINNIFIGGGGVAVDFIDLISSRSDAIVNYNIYFTAAGGNLADDGVNSYADLAAWQAAQTASNANSLEGDPIFVDPLSDLHLIGGLANDVALDTLGVMMDIDGDMRPQAPSTVPDIGADEYTPLNRNATPAAMNFPSTPVICGDTTTEISIIISNLGLDTLFNIPLTAIVTGDFATTLNQTYNDTLAPFTSDTVSFGSINTELGGFFNLEIVTNLTGDEEISNDTLRFGPIQALPFVPEVVFDSATTCEDTALLSVVPVTGANYAWYDSLTGGMEVARGNTFSIPSVSAQGTYYAAYTSIQDQITSFPNFAGGNGQNGNMFDVTALSGTITIDSLDANISTVGSATMEVYYTTAAGGYTANWNIPTAWVLAGSVTVNSNGTGVPTRVKGFTPITIPQGQTYGIYVTGNGASVSYTNGTGNDFDQNNDLRIDYGFGVGYPFASNFDPRVWNGTLYYGSPACSEIRVPSTVVKLPETTSGFTWTANLLTITLTDTSAATNDSVVYDYGDGNSGTMPMYTYALPGTYTVTQIAYGVCGTDTATAEIMVECNAAIGGFAITPDTSSLIFVNSIASGDIIDSVRYDWGDGTSTTVGSAGDATHFYQSTGEYEVCQTVYSPCGNDTSCQMTDLLIRTGLEIPGVSGIEVYPNPNKGSFYLDIDFSEMKNLKVEITDLRGKVVYSQDFGKTVGHFHNNIKIQEAASGMYFLNMKFNDQSLTRKIRVK